MEYQVDIEDFLTPQQKYVRDRNKKMVEEFKAVEKSLREQGLKGNICLIYEKVASKYGVSQWALRRALKQSN